MRAALRRSGGSSLTDALHAPSAHKARAFSTFTGRGIGGCSKRCSLPELAARCLFRTRLRSRRSSFVICSSPFSGCTLSYASWLCPAGIPRPCGAFLGQAHVGQLKGGTLVSTQTKRSLRKPERERHPSPLSMPCGNCVHEPPPLARRVGGGANHRAVRQVGAGCRPARPLPREVTRIVSPRQT